MKLTGKQVNMLAEATLEEKQALADKIQTITFDNGLEFAAQGCIAKGLSAGIYFAHSYALWKRGTNENTNGLSCQ